MNNQAILNEVFSHLVFQPVYLRQAEIDPWKDSPANLIEFIEANSLEHDFFVENISYHGETINFIRFVLPWLDNPVDILILNVETIWQMKQDNTAFRLEDCGADRGPVFKFDYEIFTKETNIFDNELDAVLKASVALMLQSTVRYMNERSLHMFDSRKN